MLSDDIAEIKIKTISLSNDKIGNNIIDY